MEARHISAWSTDMENKCGQARNKITYTFFFPGSYFCIIYRFTVRTVAAERPEGQVMKG